MMRYFYAFMIPTFAVAGLWSFYKACVFLWEGVWSRAVVMVIVGNVCLLSALFFCSLLSESYKTLGVCKKK